MFIVVASSDFIVSGWIVQQVDFETVARSIFSSVALRSNRHKASSEYVGRRNQAPKVQLSVTDNNYKFLTPISIGDLD